MEYLIIGNSAAAIGAVEGIRSKDREGKITLISDEPYHTYSRPLISYYLGGKVSLEKMAYRREDYYREQQVTPLLGKKALELNPRDRRVVLDDGQSLGYDQLLLATGGKPFIPPLDGTDKEGVHTFLKLDDAVKLREEVEAGTRVVVIGAGLIGLKAAEGLAALGADITVVELADRVLSTILSADAAAMVQAHLENQGIRFELANTGTKILGDRRVTGLELKDGRKLACDLVVVAVGVTPNTDLAKAAGIEVNRGILADEHMMTSIPGIYAAGDVAEGMDLLFNQKRVLPLWPSAYKQGETAGRNMAGKETIYPGGFALNSIGFFGLPLVTAGMSVPGEEDGYEVLVRQEPENQVYHKIILRDQRVVGLTAIGEIDRTGLITSLIREQVPVSGFKEELLNRDFGLVSLPRELRRLHLEGGAASA